MATFRMAEREQREPVSPLDAPTMSFPSRGHVMDQWRPSIETAKPESPSVKEDKPAWAPPLPPIPQDKEPEAWRKRSLKRCSLASQLSNYSAPDPSSDSIHRHRRKSSAVSSIKSTPSRNFSRPTRWTEERSQSMDLNWKMAPYNPQNWSEGKKWLHSMAAGSAAFTCTLASSIIPSSFNVVDDRFGHSSVIFVLRLALFPAGLAFGPTLNALLSGLIGRKVVLIASMAAFALVILGSAFVESFWPFVACRAAAAILASPALDASLSIVFEIWPARTKAIPLAVYSLLLFYGTAFGPIIAPYLLHFEDRPRSWMQYVILFAVAACIVPLVCLRETHRATLRRRTSSGSTFGRFTSSGFAALGRPFSLLCTQPRVLLCTLIASCNFGTLYAIITIFPSLLAAAYKGRVESRGLAFIGMIVGTTISCILLVASVCLLQHASRSRPARSSASKRLKEKPSTNHIHMDSRTSTMPFRHTPSAMSELGLSRTASRMSLPALQVEAELHDSEKNMDVAIAIANYLNDLSPNKGNTIEPERVLSALEQSLAFDDLCLLLEGYDLVFDRGVLAATLASTLPANEVEDLKMPSTTISSRVSTPVANDKMWPLSPDSPTVISQVRASQVSRSNIRPPPRKRSLYQHDVFMMLLGGLLSTGGPLMFGWTIQLEQPWIILVVATGVFASGTALVWVSTTEYLMNSCHQSDGEHAVAACNIFRWVFAAAFAIVSVPLFRALRPEWASSVLGFINAGGLLLTLILLVLERFSKTTPRSQSAA